MSTPESGLQTCFHCALPIPPDERIDADIQGKNRHFCCIGCRSVCEAIYDAGLEGFYQRTPDGTLLAPPPEPPKDLDIYDLEEIQEEFITEQGEEREIHLLVEGIHCAACVWLIEKTLGRTPGVLHASVNLSAKRLHLRWNNDQIHLSAILKKLAQIGYAAVPFDPESAEGTLKKQNRTMLYRLAFAGFTMMNLMWASIALYAGADQDEFRSLFHWLGFSLATPTLFYSGWPFLKGGWTGIRNRHLTMDLPIAIGATTTWAYSTYITVTQSTAGEVYFDTVVNFIFVILIGRILENTSKRHAVAATQRLMDLQPRVATVLRDGNEAIVPIRTVKVGDIILVKAGDKVPADGVILEGNSSLDEALLTGESEPVRKGPGGRVSAGSVNLYSALKVEVEGTLKNTALGRIIALVEAAQSSKAPIQHLSDRIVPWFVAATLTLATVTFLYWVSDDFEVALTAATAVLIITCPCAFGLATPMAIAVASGQGARHGILVKNGEVLETLSAIDHVVFDKTGTLTEGRMVVEAIEAPGRDENELLIQVAALERYSEHAIAQAIVNEVDNRHLKQRLEVQDFNSVPGFGITGTVDGHTITVGTTLWLSQAKIKLNQQLEPRVRELERVAVTCVHIAIDGEEVGIIGVADKIRDDAPQLIEDLKQQGIDVTLLSGDRRQVAEAVAEKLGGLKVIAEVLPGDKDRVISELQQQGQKVAMVGDGVNDAPALIRADVGIAVGSGTDVSMECADIVLMSNELEKVKLTTALSRRTLRTIRQNIAISITYNIIMVPLAMAAFITPLVAAISMPLSSLAVIGNAARIRTLFKKR